MAKKFTQEEFKQKVKLANPDIEIIGEYRGLEHKVLVKNKYGFFNCAGQILIDGREPSVGTAVDKNQYFANKANEIFNYKYDYSLVKYKNHLSKVKIICFKHGEFEQAPTHHLRGQGCRRCAYEKNVGWGWTHSNWEESGLKSKNFTGFKCYIIECWNDEERFYKIGKTFNEVSHRFTKKQDLPYEWKIIQIYEGSARYISELEINLHREYKEFKYKPLINFPGMYECFNKIKL